MHYKNHYQEGSERILKPFEVPTLAGMIYNQLLQAIVSAQIRPGERLVTDRIAKQMNVSPIPVREALSRLKEAGFISYQKNKGAVVNELYFHIIYR